ncbi:hypothetical protein J6590_043326 [Homalodisca vitripennis]|nr:hypothetical protein J6590_043326 [Homalodisca vitripennis]
MSLAVKNGFLATDKVNKRFHDESWKAESRGRSRTINPSSVHGHDAAADWLRKWYYYELDNRLHITDRSGSLATASWQHELDNGRHITDRSGSWGGTSWTTDGILPIEVVALRRHRGNTSWRGLWWCLATVSWQHELDNGRHITDRSGSLATASRQHELENGRHITDRSGSRATASRQHELDNGRHITDRSGSLATASRQHELDNRLHITDRSGSLATASRQHELDKGRHITDRSGSLATASRQHELKAGHHDCRAISASRNPSVVSARGIFIRQGMSLRTGLEEIVRVFWRNYSALRRAAGRAY